MFWPVQPYLSLMRPTKGSKGALWGDTGNRSAEDLGSRAHRKLTGAEAGGFHPCQSALLGSKVVSLGNKEKDAH